ncbi:MAG TPA: lipid-binding SYLF domain-containing protein [Dongiaceae bacterium]|jgi:lipid-binding SYLF domain-containing protein|nr:lipid-binding SYLF domain-containing protein [Dongiaceae bacterium]
MKNTLFLALLGILVPLKLAFALSPEQELIEEARLSFEKLVSSEEFPQLADYVKRSRAVMIFPDVFKGGFVVGGEGGTGVLMVRKKEGGWSQPAFYTLAAGSVGLQIGAQSSEVIFTIMNSNALDSILDNQVKFGAGVSVAAGPLGKGLAGSTTTNLDADVYSFAKTSGLFAGASFDGSGILKRDSYNHAYYGSAATPYAIVIQGKYHNPNTQDLLNALAPY